MLELYYRTKSKNFYPKINLIYGDIKPDDENTF